MNKLTRSKLKIFPFLIFLIMTTQVNNLFASTDRPSIHGMLMIGEKSIYLSHLPMFHSPHDYQVIIEVNLDGANNPTEIYKQDHKTSKENIYTLVPDAAFRLPEKIQNLESFSATIYRGHFERGGIAIAQKVLVHIKKIVYFKKFVQSEDAELTYNAILFGSDSELFIAHKISACADFDQILSVELSSKSDRSSSNFISLVLKNQKNMNYLEENRSYDFQSNEIGLEEGSIKMMKQIYLETEDLVCHM